MEYLNLKESIQIDESVEKLDYREYEAHIGTDINQESGEIRIVIQNQDQFLLPSKSYLYIEGQLKHKNGDRIEPNQSKITLINNALMFLFKRVSYEMAGREIEGYNNLGRATTMKGLVTYPKSYTEGSRFMWVLDTMTSEDHPELSERWKFLNNYIVQNSTPSGFFSATIPLSHIFGFCENYDKVIYGVKHELILQRTHSNDSVQKLRVDDASGVDTLKYGKIELKTLRWRVPHVKLADEQKLKLYSLIGNKRLISINFLNRQCDYTIIPEGVTSHPWRLSIATAAEKPRYIILGFQTDKDNNQSKNPAQFDHCHLKNAFVQLNSERYPEMDLQLDFNKNFYSTAYSMLYEYYNEVINKEGCPMSMVDYRLMYPLFVFDISRQSERLKNSITDVTIKTEFSAGVPENTIAYALILSDREINLQSDGNKMNIVY
jgi:hypothetical protein